MATTSQITGRVLLPDNSPPVDGVIKFVLSGVDTDTGEVIAPYEVSFELEVDGDLPADCEVYQNSEGLRGTIYRVYVLHSLVDAFGAAAKRREVLLGTIQINGAGPHLLSTLLNAGAPTLPTSWVLAITQEQYDAAIEAAVDAAASAELARIYSLQAGSYFEETDTAMGLVLIPVEITIITRIPAGTSLDQVAIEGELSWWKRTTLPSSQPYFTTSGGVVWTQVGYRESEVLSTLHSAMAGAYGSIRHFSSRADVLTWIGLNPAPAAGSVLHWGGLSVRFVSLVVTTISDMVGYVPNGVATPEHHGWDAAQTTANQTLAVQATLQAGYPDVLFSGGNTYLVDYVYALLTAPIEITIRGTIKGSNDAAFLTSVVMRLDAGTSNRFSIRVDMSGIFDGSLRTNTAGVPSGSGLCIRYSDNWAVTGGGLFYSGESRTSGFGDSGIVPEYTRKGYVEGMFFRGWNDHGIYATAGATGNTAQYADDLTVVNCHFSQIGAGDIRFARDYHRLKVANCTSVDSGKLLVVAGGSSNFVSGDQISVMGNSVDNCASTAIDIRYTNSASGNIVCGNHIYDWAMSATGNAINVRGASNTLIYGNIIKPRAFAQGASATSCTSGVYITDATGDDGAAYISRNVSVFGNQIQVFDRSAEAGPPAHNTCIKDLTGTASIYDNDLINVYPFDIYAGSGGTDASIGSALVRRKSSLGVGFGGVIPTRNLTVANHARITRADDATRCIDFDLTSTSHLMYTFSPPTSARGLVVDVKTDASNTAPSSGTLSHTTRINGATKLTVTDASVAALAPVGLWSRTVAQANAITPTAGLQLYISNESGGAVTAFADGTNWRRVTDRAVIT